MKKYILSLSVIILISLSGCGRPDKKEITFSVGGAPNELDFWEQLADRFTRQSGVKVTILRQPTDTDLRRQGLLVPLIARQRDPDVFLMDIGWLGQFIAAGWLETLDDYVRQEGVSTEVFFERVLKGADILDGRLYALPVYIDAGLLYYRADLLERYGYPGPPETWDELVECAIRVQNGMRHGNPSFYGFVWQGAQYEGLVCNFLEYAVANNGGLKSTADRLQIDTPANVAALQFMCDLIWRHKISPPNTYTELKEEEVRAFFQQSGALFERNWPYAWALHQGPDSKVKGKCAIAVLPRFPDGVHAAALGGWHIGVSRYSDAKKSAWSFVKYVTSYAVQKELTMGLGWNPGRRDVYDDGEILKTAPHLATLKDVFTNAVARPNLPYYTHISETIQKYTNAALAGKLDPGKALAAAQDEIDRIVERYRKE